MTQPPPTPIDQHGKYVLGALLGAGGMAEVYRGHTTGAAGFERRVAIKRVLGPYSSNAAFVEMFTSEARLAALLNHPCIVAVHDFAFDLEGRLFQVIEYVDGVDLEKLLASDARFAVAAPALVPPGPLLPLDLISYILGDVLEALQHAHTAKNHAGRLLGIVHRDCTPSNVLLSWEGAVKLSDFGVAKAMQATNATRSGSAKGKPSYMAPEQLQGAADMDGRVDLFACGVMLYEMLTGRRPFIGDTMESLMFAVASYGRGELVLPSPIDVMRGSVPESLSRLAMRLMARLPVDRPPTARAALMELHQAQAPAQRGALALLLARRWHNKAPRSEAELLTPAHALPTHIAVARAGAAAASQATFGQTPPPMGDLALPSARTRRRGLAVAITTSVVALGTAIMVAVWPTSARQSASAPSAVEGPLPSVDAGVDTPDPEDARPTTDAAQAAPTDAAIDAPAAVDAQKRPPPGPRRSQPPPPPRSPMIEKTI